MSVLASDWSRDLLMASDWLIYPDLRLYRWAQATVRNTELSDAALAGLGQAMGHLQHREMLFQVNDAQVSTQSKNM